MPRVEPTCPDCDKQLSMVTDGYALCTNCHILFKQGQDVNGKFVLRKYIVIKEKGNNRNTQTKKTVELSEKQKIHEAMIESKLRETERIIIEKIQSIKKKYDEEVDQSLKNIIHNIQNYNETVNISIIKEDLKLEKDLSLPHIVPNRVSNPLPVFNIQEKPEKQTGNDENENPTRINIIVFLFLCAIIGIILVILFALSRIPWNFDTIITAILITIIAAFIIMVFIKYVI